jgi:hypothetical protein
VAPLRKRPTADIIVLMLTAVVGLVVLFVAAVAIGGLITGHATDVKELIQTVGDMISSLIAVIIGFVGGRGVQGNGNGDGPKPPE